MDFTVYYDDFENEMTVEEFENQLEDLGGNIEYYDYDDVLDGKVLTEEERDNLSNEDYGRCKKVPVCNNDVQAIFYDYNNEAEPFYKKYGHDHAAAVKAAENMESIEGLY